MNANIPTVKSPTKAIVKIIRFTVRKNPKKLECGHKPAFEKMLDDKYTNYIVASREDLKNATENLSLYRGDKIKVRQKSPAIGSFVI